MADGAALDGRLPPHNLDAEAAVLSAVMLDPPAFHSVADLLLPEDFYSEAHRRIYEAVVSLRSRGQPSDIVTVAEQLRKVERIAQVGGTSYLTEIINASPAVVNVRHYAMIVVKKAKRRAMIASCQAARSPKRRSYTVGRPFGSL